MTEATTDDVQDVAPVEFPEQIIRHNFDLPDRIRVGAAFTAWPEATRVAFVELLAETRPSDVPQVVGDFLNRNPIPEEGEAASSFEPLPPATVHPDQEKVSAPVTTVPDPGAGAGANDNAGGDDGADDKTGDDEPLAPKLETPVAELETALDTFETAKAYGKEHPAELERLIALEESKKGRSTVLNELRRLVKKRDEQD